MAKKKTAGTQTAPKESKETARPMAKTAVNKELATRTGLEGSQVAAVMDSLAELIRRELSKKGTGVFVLPGMVKLQRVKIAARKAGKKPNPFKPGETMAVKARKASVKIKPVVLKGLKELAGGS
jgi:nucleoid DNA-binding protein